MEKTPKSVAVLGSSPAAAQCALTLAQLGAEVTLVAARPALSAEDNTTAGLTAQERISLWPLVLRAGAHPRIRLVTGASLDSVSGKQGAYTLRINRLPRFVKEELCTACGRCEEACPVKLPVPGGKTGEARRAIHTPLPGRASPCAYTIEKNGTAACQVSCPLGINIPGFICLLRSGKPDEALKLITGSAPLAGILGRVCTHPCESRCKRSQVDAPVYIQSLHRYSADHASGITYERLAPAGFRKDRVAIIGSGPAGLSAAWELARRGYAPAVFESHAVVGGMLATGIPRFRLPREVREHEVEAIRNMGVEFRTGITVGRDVTISDLRERGFRAFFLAVGASVNNTLGIPGEDLEGVVDGISLLFALNVKVGAAVGSNVAVIGGGNSAVDSARAIRRQGKGRVRILYRRTAEEMTAIKEDVEEALKEGITIEYLTAPVAILGDGVKVTGIRCQLMALGDPGPDGRRRPVPIPDSDFDVDADHVVVAIGQRPNTSNMRGLGLNADGTVVIDPLTLETNQAGMFAGGDCVTGPNNVVEAMASGLRAAESIDRYLRGRDLKRGRTAEKPEPDPVDVKERFVSNARRARMPTIPRARRMGTFEETDIGLPPESMEAEVWRCLNCSLCGGCLQCEEACRLRAVNHGEAAETLKVPADAVVSLSEPGSTGRVSGHGIVNVELPAHDVWLGLDLASAAALDVAGQLRLAKEGSAPGPAGAALASASAGARSGAVVCHCGDSSEAMDFKRIVPAVIEAAGATRILEVPQACSAEGAHQIADFAARERLDRLVVAACRCCNLEQTCFSCGDRRIRLKQGLDNTLPPPLAATVQYANIREQCAWPHYDDKVGAADKAVNIISSSIARVGLPPPPSREERNIEQKVLVIGTSPGTLAAAGALGRQGYPVSIVAGPAKMGRSDLKKLKAPGIEVRPWPVDIELSGAPGAYRSSLKYTGTKEETPLAVTAGSLVVDAFAIKGLPSLEKGLLGRILHRHRYSGGEATPPAALREAPGSTGIVILPGGGAARREAVRGQAAAAAVASFLANGIVRPGATAVTVNDPLCRGCGDCAGLCPYIEMVSGPGGTNRAKVDDALCLGCGACLSVCPTGAISQPGQSEEALARTVASLLSRKKSGETIVFSCNWDGLSCIEATAYEGTTYPASVVPVRATCLSRVHAGLILKAFEQGAAGVMLLGCAPGSCHLENDGQCTDREYDKAAALLGLLGIGRERLALARLPRGDGRAFGDRVKQFVKGLPHV